VRSRGWSSAAAGSPAMRRMSGQRSGALSAARRTSRVTTMVSGSRTEPWICTTGRRVTKYDSAPVCTVRQPFTGERRPQARTRLLGRAAAKDLAVGRQQRGLTRQRRAPGAVALALDGARAQHLHKQALSVLPSGTGRARALGRYLIEVGGERGRKWDALHHEEPRGHHGILVWVFLYVPHCGRGVS
jgi:hypothetical protein